MESGARLRQRLGGTMGRTADKKLFGKIWPNGNFSLGVGAVGTEALELSEDDGENQARWGGAGDIAAAVAALTSSNGANPHTDVPARPQMGLKGITAHGQQMLRSGCFLMERDYGNGDLCFATLTVPNLSESARRKLHSNWAELVRQLLQWVSRKLLAAGRPIKVAGCVEIQSARLQRSGEGYLHLHLVWPSHSNVGGQTWAIPWAECRAWWGRALERFSGEALPHHPRVELAPVRKSAERYMGKYLSKGSGEALDAYIEDHGVESVPACWWFMSAALRHQIKGETCRGPNTGTILDAVIQTALDDGDTDIFEWIRPVMMVFTDRPVHIGWCGRLRADIREDIRAMLSCLLNCD